MPWCPHCGCEGGYEYAPRKVAARDSTPKPARLLRPLPLPPKECRHDFSVTSGTILQAVALSTQSVKGKAALQLSRELSVQ